MKFAVSLSQDEHEAAVKMSKTVSSILLVCYLVKNRSKDTRARMFTQVNTPSSLVRTEHPEFTYKEESIPMRMRYERVVGKLGFLSSGL